MLTRFVFSVPAGEVFMITVTRRMTFSAAHRLFNPEFSDAENERVFGLCNNPAGHGHNYTLEVTVAGEPDPKTGMVINLSDLKAILQTEVISKVDHKNLNVDVEFMQGCVPTAEMLAIRIWDQLTGKLPSVELREVTVYESPNNVASRTA